MANTPAQTMNRLSEDTQQALTIARSREPNLETLVACMDKIERHIASLKDFSTQELNPYHDQYMKVRGNLENLEKVLREKSLDIQGTLTKMNNRLSAANKYSSGK